MEAHPNLIIQENKREGARLPELHPRQAGTAQGSVQRALPGDRLPGQAHRRLVVLVAEQQHRPGHVAGVLAAPQLPGPLLGCSSLRTSHPTASARLYQVEAAPCTRLPVLK